MVKNPSCRECNVPTQYLSPEERLAQTTDTHVPPESVDHFDLSTSRSEGWRVEMFCHGRREVTRVMYAQAALLESSESRHGLVGCTERGLWEDLPIDEFLGVYDDPDTEVGFLPSVLQVGKFPVWNDAALTRRRCRAPIVHLAVWFEAGQIVRTSEHELSRRLARQRGKLRRIEVGWDASDGGPRMDIRLLDSECRLLDEWSDWMILGRPTHSGSLIIRDVVERTLGHRAISHEDAGFQYINFDL